MKVEPRAKAAEACFNLLMGIYRIATVPLFVECNSLAPALAVEQHLTYYILYPQLHLRLIYASRNFDY